MSSWSGPRPPPPRGERSRSPSRGAYGRGSYPDPYPPDYYHRERDPYDRERGWSERERDWPGHEYSRRGRSRSPAYDDLGRKRRRSMSPYDRDRYEPRPRRSVDSDDPWKGFGHPPPGSSKEQWDAYKARAAGRKPVDPYSLDHPASLKQFAEWFRFMYPKEANDEDLADKQAERDVKFAYKPRNGIKLRWEKYKKEFLAKQLQTLFDHHRKYPWFAEKYDPSPEMNALRTRVRKVGWRGRINQFINDLENGKYDKGDTFEGDSQSASPKEGSVPADGGATEETESPTKPEEDFGVGLENEDDADNAGDSKNDANGKMSYDSKQNEIYEVSVPPEGNQVMIRTIPPDIGRVKLENVLKEYSSFVYLALGDPMQKRNYYRAGWIKFDEHADMQDILATLGEKKIEGFKLHLNHNTRPFTSKARITPDVASRPDRIAKDLTQARRLAEILEDEYERVRTFRLEPPATQPEAAESGDQPPPEDILTRDALAEDEPPVERGTDTIRRRIEQLIADLPEPSDETEAKALELKKNTIALDVYLAYLRAAFHTCYYCVSISDHAEELQRKCIKHIRKPLPQERLQELLASSKSEGDEGARVEDEDEESKDANERQNKQKEKGNKKEAILKGRDSKAGESKRNDERWAEWLDNKVALLTNRDGIDVHDYGGKNYEEELAKACEPHVNREGEERFRCKTCTKLFRASTFIERHIINKHPELVKELEDLPYYNNFALDPQRIQPYSHLPTQTGMGPPVPPQAYGWQNTPKSYNDRPPGSALSAPVYYAFPGGYAPLPNGGNINPDPYGAGYPLGFPYPPPIVVPPPIRNVRDEPGNGGGGGRRLGDRIGGYAPDSGRHVGGHGIEGLPAKPIAIFEPGPGGRRNGGSARGGAPPPPPDVREDPRAASGRKVSYHDMDLVAEGDVELNY